MKNCIQTCDLCQPWDRPFILYRRTKVPFFGQKFYNVKKVTERSVAPQIKKNHFCGCPKLVLVHLVYKCLDWPLRSIQVGDHLFPTLEVPSRSTGYRERFILFYGIVFFTLFLSKSHKKIAIEIVFSLKFLRFTLSIEEQLLITEHFSLASLGCPKRSLKFSKENV